MKACLIINDTDYIKHVAQNGGIKWSLNDLDSEDAGRTLDGVMHRARIATKHKFVITCVPINGEVLAEICSAIRAETFEAILVNPETNEEHVYTFYSSSVEGATAVDLGEETLWEGVTFPLIEV